MRSSQVINEDCEKIKALDNLKKSSRKNLSTRGAMLSSPTLIKNTRMWIDVDQVDCQSTT